MPFHVIHCHIKNCHLPVITFGHKLNRRTIDSLVFVVMLQMHMTMHGSCVRTTTMQLHCVISRVTLVCMNTQRRFLFAWFCMLTNMVK